MVSGYEALVNMVKADLTNLDNKTEDNILESVESMRARCQKRYNIVLSDEDIQRAVAELLNFYAVTITDEDSELFESRIRSTWWTDSYETRKKENKNYYWDSYREYLIKKEKLPEDVIDRINERSDKVMNFLFDPTNPDIKDATRRGMVIGSVQSGKTANYSAVIAKAADAGYKIIIVIAGISSLLRKQTQNRINCGFVGQTDLNKDEPDVISENMAATGTVAAYRRPKVDELERMRPYTMTTERMSGDFKTDSRKALNQTNLNNTTSPIILVIKKNTSVLEQLIEWLKGKDLSEKSLLLIDDEADNASVNTKKEYDILTTINRKICAILKNFKKFAYIGFTATPFANIFIDPQFDENPENRNLYPQDFIISLVSPDNYFGPQQVFGYDNPSESDYIRLLPLENTTDALADWQQYFPVKQKKDVTCHKMDNIPDTLKEAIQLFIFNIYVRNHRGFKDKHNSMLIHVSHLVDMHKAVKGLVEKYLKDLGNVIRNYSGMKGTKEYIQNITPLEDLFENMIQKHWASSEEYKTLDFENILAEMPGIIESITVGMSNIYESSIVYSSEHQTNMIAIGGNSLARGFTIENLSVSYFLRNTKMCDTLLQMGRWFGYRRGYEDLCRIYTTEEYYNNFHDALIATNSLVNCVKNMEKAGKTPLEFLVTVSQHPATRMILTAKNKMYNAENDKGVSLDGTIREKGTYEHAELEEVAKYFNETEEFISKLGSPENTGKCYRWLDIHADYIVDLIKKCPRSFTDQIDSELLARYVKENRNFKWRVVLPYKQSGNRLTLSKSNLSFYKFERFDKLDDDMISRSFSVSDISNERLGSLPGEYSDKDTRPKLREKRNDPLLIINIFDLYKNQKNSEKILIKNNVPFFSLSFPGSFEKRKFKPLTNFIYNRKLQEKLREDVREQEKNTDDEDFRYE